jgi:hypothetical protein
MPLDAKQQKQIMDLLILSLEGEASQKDLQELRSILNASEEARAYYLRAIIAAECIRRSDWQMSDFDSESVLSESMSVQMWEALSREEKTAPYIKLPAVMKDSEVPVPPAAVKKERPPVSRLSIVLLALSSAALIFLVVYANLVSMKRGIEVATLTDCVQAVWGDPTLSLSKSSRLSTHQRLILSQGVASVKTDQGVSLTIEGPADFELTSGQELLLNYGRLYARVSPEGVGFIVQTPSVKMIDLGTEFGVQADVNGSSELHVMKGAVQLFAGPKERPIASMVVRENKAVRYNRNTFELAEIQVEKYKFVRSFDSQTRTLWRGQSFICLADLVGGGNGSGTAKRNQAIAWDGQGLTDALRLLPSPQTLRAYMPVRFSPFVDGIFIPSSQNEPTLLRSERSELNLDEFLRQDTNGLVTLLVLKEDSDDASIYWFASKEGAQGDLAKMPALYFPQGRNAQPVFVTTAEGRGADTYVTNDVLNRTFRRYGQSGYLHCRYIQDERVRMILLRFDIGQIQDVSGALLNLSLYSGNRKRELAVWGLQDGPEDFWDEEGLDYRTAPGVKSAPFGRYELDERVWKRLGTFRVIDNRSGPKAIPIVSDGSVRWTAPESMGQTAYPITYAERIRNPLFPEQVLSLQIGGQACSADNPAVLLHANAGITFNLDALRTEYGRLKSFTALCGVSPAGSPETRENLPRANFYVLLDGQEAFAAEDLTPEDAPKPVHIVLPTSCRYLTLIATQGSDDSIDNDLCLFARPRIHLGEEK